MFIVPRLKADWKLKVKLRYLEFLRSSPHRVHSKSTLKSELSQPINLLRVVYNGLRVKWFYAALNTKFTQL